MDSKAIVRSLRKSYVDTQKANPQTVADGQWMTKYLRNKFVFFGLKKPLRVSADKPVLERHKAQLQDRTVLLQLLPLLWEQDEREFQHFGGEVARKYRQELLGETEMEFNEAIDCAYHLITTRSWWDTIDMLAINIVGYFVKQRPKLGIAVMDRWKKDNNMWLRRTAILHQLTYKGDTNQAWLFECCKLRAHETEFFIQKAIGWALREYAKTNPSAIRKFVTQNKQKLSRLSTREAMKHL